MALQEYKEGSTYFRRKRRGVNLLNLEGSKILLGVTGSIAVYKAATLVRELVKAGAEVKVIMTKGATDFVAPLTFSTLSKNPVIIQYANEQDGTWNNHVELALWADLFIIAPATANTIAKCANGICDNVMMATYLSAKCPVALAPAMDLDMYKHPATKKISQPFNLTVTLLSRPNMAN